MRRRKLPPLARYPHLLDPAENLLKSRKAAVDIPVDNFVDKSERLRGQGFALSASLFGRWGH